MDNFYIEGIISFLEILVLALIFSGIVMFATEFTKNIFKKFNISSWIFVIISLIISAAVCMGLVKTFMDGILSTGDGIWLTFLTWLGSNGMFRYLEDSNTFLGKLVKSFSSYYLDEIEKQAGISSGFSDNNDEGVDNCGADGEDDVKDDEVSDEDDSDTGNDFNGETDGDEPYIKGDEEIGSGSDIGEDNTSDIKDDRSENIRGNIYDEINDSEKEGIEENKDYTLERNEEEYPSDTSDIFINQNIDEVGNGLESDKSDSDSIENIQLSEGDDTSWVEDEYVIKTPEDEMIELIMKEVSEKSDLNDGTGEPNEEILSQFSVTCDDDVINENAPVQKGDLVFNPTTQSEAMENRDLRYE